MRHLDLFSGIGGFALATEMVWDAVEHIFCDNDPFSQAVLRKHWPNAFIYGDIRNLTADTIKSFHTTKPIDILTGGFPCQPFSAAGKRLGTDDNRHLWPEMLRVIRETHPRYVVGENVSGFLTWNGGLVFEQVCLDLESEGYEVGAFVIPAYAIGAPHRRDRVWIVAHSNTSNESNVTQHEKPRRRKLGSNATNARRKHGSTRGDAGMETSTSVGSTRITYTERRSEDVAYTFGARREGQEQEGRQLERQSSWAGDWSKVATKLCVMDDGLPNGLARPRGWRNAALKGAGNAIVPQVAAEIMIALASIENDTKANATKTVY